MKCLYCSEHYHPKEHEYSCELEDTNCDIGPLFWWICPDCEKLTLCLGTVNSSECILLYPTKKEQFDKKLFKVISEGLDTKNTVMKCPHCSASYYPQEKRCTLLDTGRGIDPAAFWQKCPACNKLMIYLGAINYLCNERVKEDYCVLIYPVKDKETIIKNEFNKEIQNISHTCKIEPISNGKYMEQGANSQAESKKEIASKAGKEAANARWEPIKKEEEEIKKKAEEWLSAELEKGCACDHIQITKYMVMNVFTDYPEEKANNLLLEIVKEVYNTTGRKNRIRGNKGYKKNTCSIHPER